jgi:glycosyltransferase involved in cell wall biosynthesis
MKTLGFIGGQSVSEIGGKRFTHITTGRVLEEFARYYDKIYLGASISSGGQVWDYPIPDNVDIIQIPDYLSSREALTKIKGIRQGYKTVAKLSDDIFVRGIIPGLSAFLKACYTYKKKPLVWLVGNPIALLRSHRRDNLLVDNLGLWYSLCQEWQTKRLVRKSGGAFYCNGIELYERVAGYPRYEIASSVILEKDFFIRNDTCAKDPITVTTICFMRPEKGIQYLVEAISLLKTDRKIQVRLVGSRNRYPNYQAHLDRLIREKELGDRISFPGHASAPEVLNHLKESDIFVLPTLSEGTPHAVIEAMTCGIPVVASEVGGIPTIIKNKSNGIMVPSKDPQAIASAIDRIIEDDDLRRNMIQNGYERARELTVDKFVDKAVSIIDSFQSS